MSTVLEIESAIEKLPSAECRKLLAWFQKYLVASATSVAVTSHAKKEEFLLSDDVGVVNVAHELPEKKLSGFEILGDLVGSIKNAPRDLSSNPKYLAGYGREDI